MSETGTIVTRRGLFRAAATTIGMLVLLGVAIPASGAVFGTGGPRDQISGAEPGTEKSRMIEQFQREYETALLATMAPPAGRPVEQWHPVIVAGIDNSAESPFEGRDFTISNMWRSELKNGRVTQVYAGLYAGAPVVIVTVLELMSGTDELRLVLSLPADAGLPRIAAAQGEVLVVSTASGRSFEVDTNRRTLRGSD